MVAAMEHANRSPLRILAPVALLAFGLAMLLVIASAGDSGDSGTTRSANEAKQRDLDTGNTSARRERRSNRANRLPQGVYIVKAGDTLGSIAAKTGVPVEKLQELNPDLDPQALVSGQRIRLR